MPRVVHHKLVRDKIPDIITEDGSMAKTRILKDDERLSALVGKLMEEAAEVRRSEPEKRVEELADVLEVLQEIAREIGVTWGAVEREQARKHLERGGFSEGIFLEYTETPDTPS